MSPVTMEHDALVDEINARITDINNTEGAEGTCRSHDPFGRALATILRVNRAQLEERQRERDAYERDRKALPWRVASIAVPAGAATAGIIIEFFK